MDNSLLNMNKQYLIQAQEADPELQVIMNWVLTDRRPPFSNIKAASPEMRQYWRWFPKLTLVDGLLCYFSKYLNLYALPDQLLWLNVCLKITSATTVCLKVCTLIKTISPTLLSSRPMVERPVCLLIYCLETPQEFQMPLQVL